MTRESNPTVLLADDQADVREALRLLLKSEGIASVGVDGPAAALEAVRQRDFSCALIDLNYTRDTTSGDEGLALLDALRQHAPELPVVVMTAWGNVPLVVDALRRGAGDFIEKPWDNARLLSIVRTQIALGEGARRQRRLEAENALLRGGGEALIAESPAMRRVMELVARIAPSDANVLVLGENGTGKGVIAQALHAQSRRAAKALVKVNMGGIAENVFESEMFGHVRGAYHRRQERAHRPLRAGRRRHAVPRRGRQRAAIAAAQIAARAGGRRVRAARLLAHAERRRAAGLGHQCRPRRRGGGRPLPQGSAVPPQHAGDPPAAVARARDDILPLARSFLERSAARYGRHGLRLAPSAERALLAWRWPGNVRELGHLMERAALLAEHDLVSDSALAFGPGSDDGRSRSGARRHDHRPGRGAPGAARAGASRRQPAACRRCARHHPPDALPALEKHGLRDPSSDDAG